MIPRSDFDLMYVTKLIEVLRATSPENFPHIHGRAKNDLLAVERQLANPHNENLKVQTARQYGRERRQA